MKPVIKWRTLTQEGKNQFGNIFGKGVPCQKNGMPIHAKLEGSSEAEGEFVFLVDWASLTEVQQEACLSFMAEKFDVSVDSIRERIETNGHFPMRHCYLIEAYDMRFFV